MSVISFKDALSKRKQNGASKSQSKQSATSAPTGQNVTDEEAIHEQVMLSVIYGIVDRAWRKPFTTKSETARYAADIIGICASEGLITTAIEQGRYGNLWLVTEEGLEFLRHFREEYTTH